MNNSINNYQTVIGLEIHAVVKSQTKMFSSSKSSHTDKINTNINEIDLALPGTLPSINELVIKKALCLANVLHMQIADTIIFDRKNYFYFDLPKGYQITQQTTPLATNGYIEVLDLNNKTKKITIERIQLEEDTAKQIRINENETCLDFNRCGMPLIEIVTKPEINSASEAVQFLIQLKRILNFYAEISDAKMEEGSLRVDVNISIHSKINKKKGIRVEIKNLNSFNNIAKAIEYEQKRQINLLNENKIISQETRRYDEITNKTIFMRNKDNEINYKFIVEPNILSFNLPQKITDEAKKMTNISLLEIEQNLKSLNIKQEIINQLLNNYQLYKIFTIVSHEIKNLNLVITWIVNELVGLLKKENKTISIITTKQLTDLIELLKMIDSNKINTTQAKNVFTKIIKNNLPLNSIIKNTNNYQITNENELKQIIKKIIENFKDDKKFIKLSKTTKEKIIMGLLMKYTKGKANPQISINILREILITD